MKWFRWKGLIAFVVLLFLLVTVWLFFVDVVIKAAVEKTGTHLVGAKVELAAADLSFSPLGLSLTGLQVTNPGAPMTNAVQVDRVALALEGAKLLRRKVILKEMTLDGVRLNTPRNKSGAISSKRAAIPVPSKSPSDEKTRWPSLKVPSVEEILQKEKLRSLEMVESLRTDLQAEKAEWQGRVARLPDKAKLEQYRKRIEALMSGKQRGLEGILGGASEILAVKKELSRDLDSIKAARQELEQDVASMRKRIDEVKRTPQADIRRLREKYAPAPKGLTNVSQLLFGERISSWVDTVLNWYEKLGPVLERAKERKRGPEVVKPVRGKGVNVRFKEHEPYPDFLIRIAQVSVEIPAGLIRGQIRNITPDQDVLGVPLTYEFSGGNLTGLGSVKIDGSLDHVDPFSTQDTANLQIRGYQLSDVTLSDRALLPVILKKAAADFKARAALSGEALEASLSAGLESVDMATSSQDEAGGLMKALASAVSDIKAFGVKAQISGTLEDYDLQLSSDLDRVLKDAVRNQVKAQAVRLEKELQSAIFEKVGEPMADVETSLGGLGAVSSELSARLKLGDELLKRTRKSGPSGMKLPF
jgi:uncharacterized protein (TIGR03545 family)